MVRILIVAALVAIALALIGSFAPGPLPPVDAAAAPAVPAARYGLPSLDFLSFGLGALIGLILGWIWALPWRNMRELSRELFLRSMRGFGIVGLAMAAAAILLFY